MEEDPAKNQEKELSGNSDDSESDKKSSKSAKKKQQPRSKRWHKDTEVAKEKKTEKPAAYFKQDSEQDTTAESLEKAKKEVEKAEKKETAQISSDETQQATEESKEQVATHQEVEADNETDNEADNLSEEEVHETINAIIDDRSNELSTELSEAEDGSPEEMEALADVLFLESLRTRADGEQEVTEKTINEAYTEALEDFDIVDDDNGKELEDDAEEVNEEGLEPEDRNLDESDVVVDDTVENDPNQTLPSPPDAPIAPVPPVPPNSPPTPPITSTPPTPPNPPGNPGGFGMYPLTPPPHSPGSPPAGHNTATHAPATRETVFNRRRRGRDMLVGSVLGYIVGRRGGRKRTEKKLIPKIDKLEKQVGQLHDVITEREEKIRKLTRHKVEQAPEKIPEVLATAVEKRTTKTAKKEQQKRSETLKSNPKVEKLGSFNLKSLEVFREKRLIDGHENSPKRKAVEIMTVEELLEKVDEVKIDGMYIVEAYKKGRIDAEALREVTKLYLRSGDFAQHFRRELQTSPAELQTKREQIKQAIEVTEQSEHQQEVKYEKLSPTQVSHTVVNPEPVNRPDVANTNTGTKPGHESLPEIRSSKPASKLPLPMPYIVAVATLVSVGVLFLILQA